MLNILKRRSLRSPFFMNKSHNVILLYKQLVEKDGIF